MSAVITNGNERWLLSKPPKMTSKIILFNIAVLSFLFPETLNEKITESILFCASHEHDQHAVKTFKGFYIFPYDYYFLSSI